MHKHEWWLHDDMGWIEAKCGCGEVMTGTEARRRINATECLPAWAAEQFGWGQRLNFGPKQQGYKICDMLVAYSEALEGSDE